MLSTRSLIAFILLATVILGGAGVLGWRLLAYPGLLPEDQIDETRRVQVIFQSQVLGGLPVRFSPTERIQWVTPGKDVRNTYIFHNYSDQDVFFTPLHSVAPADAARHYSMSVCFCFYDQRMPANSTAEFTVVYRLDPRLSARTNPVHINYNLHRIEAEQFRREPSIHGEGSEIQIISQGSTDDWNGGNG